VRWVAAAAAVAALAGFAVPAASAPFLIVGDKEVGGVRMGATLSRATTVLGAPDTTSRMSNVECRAVWRSLGLTLTFLDFSNRPCASGGAVIAIATAAQWQTLKGLRVGQRIARLRRLYPGATLHRGAPYDGWWLIPRRTCAEVGSQAYPGLLARVAHKRITAFVVTVAACE
jgi:hypothetical protein